MINLSKLQWIVVGVVVLIVIVLLDVLIGTTITPRLIATPTPTMPTNVLFVKPEANGYCRENWSHACDLQTALSYALPGEEIWAVKGTYKPTSEKDQMATFQLKSGVALYGGFVGNETSRDERNWEENITILSGDIDGNDITENGVITDTSNIKGENSYHVVAGSGTDDTAILDGFTITGGQANGPPGATPCGHACGGGMFNNGGSPALANVTFSGNRAGQGGGGMFNYNGSPVLSATQFISNSAARWGGGMFNDTNSNSKLTDVTFSGNTAAENGGGMHNFSSSPVLIATQFINNTAPLGGGIGNNIGNPTLINTNFISNTAKQDGGGMYNWDNSSPTLTNVIFKGNKATAGGGLYNRESSGPTLTNLTFYGNIAEGGGIYNFYNHIPITLTNCIVWGNKDSIINVASTTNIFYSLVEGECPEKSTCEETKFNADPEFVNPDKGDLHLQLGSPALDAGYNAAVEDAGVTTDLDGNPRICNNVVDMGAYEYQTPGCTQP